MELQQVDPQTSQKSEALAFSSRQPSPQNGEQALINMTAPRHVDPTLDVLATSSGPNERRFDTLIQEQIPLVRDERLKRVFLQRLDKTHPLDLNAVRYLADDIRRTLTREELRGGPPILAEALLVSAQGFLSTGEMLAVSKHVLDRAVEIHDRLLLGRGVAIGSQVFRFDAVNRSVFASESETMYAMHPCAVTIDCPPKISVVVINHNSLRHLVRCLEELPVTLAAVRNVELILVDNGSDKQSDWLYRTFRWGNPRSAFGLPRNVPTWLIRSERNLGFDGGNNAAIEFATSGVFEGRGRGTDAIWCLNNDTVTDATSLSALGQELDAHPDAGVVGSVIYDLRAGTGKKKIQAAGMNFSWRFPFRPETNRAVPETSAAVDIAHGSSMLLRVAALEEAGRLNTSFFAYREELDLSLGMKCAGWKIRITPDSSVWHHTNGSSSWTDPVILPVYYSMRNTVQIAGSLPKHPDFHRGDVVKLGVQAALSVFYQAALAIGDPSLALRILTSATRGLFDGLRGRSFQRGTDAPICLSLDDPNFTVISAHD